MLAIPLGSTIQQPVVDYIRLYVISFKERVGWAASPSTSPPLRKPPTLLLSTVSMPAGELLEDSISHLLSIFHMIGNIEKYLFCIWAIYFIHYLL